MNKTIDYLKRVFQRWYATEFKPTVSRLNRRELGFLGWPSDDGKKYMNRHYTMNVPTLKDYLSHKAPMGVYHSTAYYERPGEDKMRDKCWMGGDLVFDIDCDHIPGANDLNYNDQLGLAKRHLRKLIHEFLLVDFGYEEKDIRAYFSGGRGYHVHVRDPKIWPLNAIERREIVDYIAGTGLSMKLILGLYDFNDLPEVYDCPRCRNKRHKKESKIGRAHSRFLTDSPFQYPDPQQFGWSGKIGGSIKDLIQGICEISEEESIKFLTDLLKITSNLNLSKEKIHILTNKLRKTGKTSSMSRHLGPLSLYEKNILFTLAKNNISLGEIDRAVSYDLHRFIRMPGSIHGGTGLKVIPVPVDLESLNNFDPLREAIAFPMNEEINVEVLEDLGEVFFGGEGVHVSGGCQKLPKALGIFLMCRGKVHAT